MGSFKSEAEVKKLILSILTSNPLKSTIQSLSSDYKCMIGEEIPFRRLGYLSLRDFLYAINDTVVVHGIEVTPLVTNKMSHIKDMVSRVVSKQKTNNKSRYYISSSRKTNNYFHNNNKLPTEFAPKIQYPPKNIQFIKCEEFEKQLTQNASTTNQPKAINPSPIKPLTEQNYSKVPAFIQVNLKRLLTSYGNLGIEYTELPYAYRRKFHEDLKYQSFGYSSLLELCWSLPNIMQCHAYGPDDYKLYDVDVDYKKEAGGLEGVPSEMKMEPTQEEDRGNCEEPERDIKEEPAAATNLEEAESQIKVEPEPIEEVKEKSNWVEAERDMNEEPTDKGEVASNVDEALSEIKVEEEGKTVSKLCDTLSSIEVGDKAPSIIMNLIDLSDDVDSYFSCDTSIRKSDESLKEEDTLAIEQKKVTNPFLDGYEMEDDKENLVVACVGPTRTIGTQTDKVEQPTRGLCYEHSHLLNIARENYYYQRNNNNHYARGVQYYTHNTMGGNMIPPGMNQFYNYFPPQFGPPPPQPQPYRHYVSNHMHNPPR